MSWLPVSHRTQRQPADCLAACAAMLLDFLGVSVRYGRLLRLLDTRSHGTVFSYIRRLETLGVSVQVAEGDIEALRTHLANGLPIIAFVDTAQLTSYWTVTTQHAVVVIGIDATHVYLNDPMFPQAPQTIIIDEFALAWLEQEYLYALIQLDE